MSQMQAITVDDKHNLIWAAVDQPEPGPHEVRIKVKASAVNRADLMQRRGMYPAPPGASSVLGLECSGEVEKIGASVARWRVGDEVCALLAGGGYAQYAIAHEGSVVSIPEGFNHVQAASLPEVFATAYLNLFMEAALSPGEKVVVHAGASGVGTAAIQMCKSFGNPVFITAGQPEKIETCVALGATAGFDRHQGSFLEAAREFAGDSGVGVILDPVGGQYLSDNLNLLGLGGRLVLIGLMGGASTEINLGLMMMKRLRVIGSTLRARPVAEKAVIMAELENKVWPLLETGEIKPIVDSVYPIADAGAAQDYVAGDTTVGKVVLDVAGS